MIGIGKGRPDPMKNRRKCLEVLEFAQVERKCTSRIYVSRSDMKSKVLDGGDQERGSP